VVATSSSYLAAWLLSDRKGSHILRIVIARDDGTSYR